MYSFGAELLVPVQQPLELSMDITQQSEKQEMIFDANNKSVNLVVNQGYLIDAMKDSGLITWIENNIAEYTLEVPLKGNSEDYSVRYNATLGDAIIPLTVNGTVMGFISRLIVNEKEKHYKVSLLGLLILSQVGYLVVKAVINCYTSGSWDTFERNFYNNAMCLAAVYGDICYIVIAHLRNGPDYVLSMEDQFNEKADDQFSEKTDDHINEKI